VSVNNYLPHVLVLPEDKANEELVNGFLLDPSIQRRKVHVLPCAGGWSKVLDSFETTQVDGLRKYKDRHLILLIDFDNHVQERTEKFVETFPEDVRDRVFLLGTKTEPEPLRKQLGQSLEQIGKTLAAECLHDEDTTWQHALLEHNVTERARLNAKVKGILF
jgi:hypothetical protein